MVTQTPFITQLYKPPQPHPKPSERDEPTPADFEAFGRRMYSGLVRKRELLSLIAQVQSDLDQAVNEISHVASPESIEECGECHGHHLGYCNA